jgi:hypothetical protein
MLAIKGIYDGKSILPLEKIDFKSKSKVIITFVEEINDLELEEIRSIASSTDGFDFWSDEREDLYQEYLN